MSYNLNFYPQDFGQSGFANGYNPYITLLGLDNNAGLQHIQKEAENRLQQIQNQIGLQNSIMTQNQTQNQQQTQNQYYLFCGRKEDWDEFLMLNYGMSEQAIFEDYKLFLQAKQEILTERGQNKIDNMKDKIRSKNNDNRFVKLDATVQSNVKPTTVQQPDIQPTTKQATDFNGNSNGISLGGGSEPNNGLHKQGGFQPKNINRKR